jgi:hypothetical protein
MICSPMKILEFFGTFSSFAHYWLYLSQNIVLNFSLSKRQVLFSLCLLGQVKMKYGIELGNYPPSCKN